MTGKAPLAREPGNLSELALIAANARLGDNVVVGPFSVVGRDHAEPVVVGDGAIIRDHVVIQPDVEIGAGSVIEAHCRIGRGSRIAAGTRLASGVQTAGNSERRNGSPAAVSTTAAGAGISPHALVAPNVTLGENVEIAPFAIVGWQGEAAVTIGAGTRIAPFALIEPGVVIGEDCTVDAYCRICEGGVIGDRSQILYGASVFERARIGKACIIGGNVADRTIIEDYVTHFGEIAHNYDQPGDLAAWDTVEAKSPTIRARSVVGQNALIVGPRTIGPSSYVAAGEVVQINVPEGHFYQHGELREISKMKGMVRTRTDGLQR